MRTYWSFLPFIFLFGCGIADSQEERWYDVLRSESIAEKKSVVVHSAGDEQRREEMLVLGRGQWMETARIIVQPVNVQGVPGGGFYFSNTPPSGASAKLRGDVLRTKKDPSVTELLTRAADVVVQEAGHQDQFQGVDAIRVGWELTQIIRTWEAPAVLSPARALMRRAVQLFSDPNSFIMSSGHDLARYIPALAQIRIESGDTNALAEYAAWIRSASEERVDEYAIEAFEPLWRNPKNPEVSTVSEWLFNDPASPWSKLPWKRSHFHDPLESGLVSLPAFRRLVARELENQTVVGSMEWHAGPGINIRYRLSASTGGYHFAWPETDSPGDGAKVEVRRCDWVAWVLSKSKQIPFYNPFAPLTQRDEALRRATADLAGSN